MTLTPTLTTSWFGGSPTEGRFKRAKGRGWLAMLAQTLRPRSNRRRYHGADLPRAVRHDVAASSAYRDYRSAADLPGEPSRRLDQLAELARWTSPR